MPRAPAHPHKEKRACPGRDAESARLEVALEEARAGHGGTWLVTGPEGIGKSFLLTWLESRAVAEGFTVLRGGGHGRTGAPLALFQEALAGLGARAAPSTARASAPLAPGPRLLSFVELLLKAGHERPLLLLLDDLERADPESMGAFQALSRGTGGMRCLMVGALRSSPLGDDRERRQVWERPLELLTSEGALEQLQVTGLPAATLRQIVEEVIGGPFAGHEGAEFELALAARTEGNPLFARELALQLKAEGHLVLERGKAVLRPPEATGAQGEVGLGGGWARLPVPPSLRRLVLAKLDRVVPADRHVLAVAALVGSPFSVVPLAGALARSRRGLVGTLGELETMGILRHAGDAPEEGWSFAHDLVWELSLRELPPEEVRDLAQRLATWWAETHPEDVETVARLFHDAREATGGLPWVRDAIDRALRGYATASAERFFGWYFDLLQLAPRPPAELATEALRLIDQILVRRIRPETVAVLDALRRTRLTEEMPWELGWRAVHVLISFDVRAAEHRFRALQAEFARSRRGPDPLHRAQLEFIECEIAGAHGRYKEVEALGARALEDLGSYAAPWMRGRLLYEMGWAQMMLGRLEESREYLREAQELVGSSETPTLGAILRTLEGTLYISVGDLRNAERAFREGADSLLRMGAMEGYGIARGDQAEVLLHLREEEEALPALEEAEMVAERFGFPRVAHACGVKWIWAHALAGRWSEAQERLGSVVRRAEQSGFREEYWETRLLEAWIHGETGTPGTALTEWEKVRHEEEGLQPYIRPYLYLVRSRLLELSGRPGGREALERASKLVQASGGGDWTRVVERAIAGWERRHPRGASGTRSLPH